MKNNGMFKADFAGASVLIGVFSIPLFLTLLVLAKFGWAKFVADGMLEAVAISATLPAAWIFWLSRFRLSFGPQHLMYRSGFGRAWSVAYSEIEAVTQSRAGPISKLPLAAWVKLKNGQDKLVNLKVFSAAAGASLFELQPKDVQGAA